MNCQLVCICLQFYVWHFNPPSRSSYFLGILVCEFLSYNHKSNAVYDCMYYVVIGAAAATLYPLWPQSSQLAIYYGSWFLLCIVAGIIGIFIGKFVKIIMCIHSCVLCFMSIVKNFYQIWILKCINFYYLFYKVKIPISYITIT